MDLAWPEKAILALAIGFGLFLLCFGSILNGATQSDEWMIAGAQIEWYFAKAVLAPLWVVFRVLAWASGSGRRNLTVLPPEQ